MFSVVVAQPPKLAAVRRKQLVFGESVHWPLSNKLDCQGWKGLAGTFCRHPTSDILTFHRILLSMTATQKDLLACKALLYLPVVVFPIAFNLL